MFMGDENYNEMETVEEIREEATQIVEDEEQQESSSGGFKQAVGIAGLTTLMLGAGYGLYRLGKVVAGNAKEAYRKHQEKKALEMIGDDEDDEDPFDEKEEPKK